MALLLRLSRPSLHLRRQLSPENVDRQADKSGTTERAPGEPLSRSENQCVRGSNAEDKRAGRC